MKNKTPSIITDETIDQFWAEHQESLESRDHQEAEGLESQDKIDQENSEKDF